MSDETAIDADIRRGNDAALLLANAMLIDSFDKLRADYLARHGRRVEPAIRMPANGSGKPTRSSERSARIWSTLQAAGAWRASRLMK
jgi:hypothetical protein